MKNPLKTAGVLIIIITLLMSIGDYKKIKALKYGKIVEVSVIEMPFSCNKTNNRFSTAFFKFIYNGNTHTKKLNRKYCEILENKKTIQLKTNSDHSVFVYLDEDFTFQYLSNFSLIIIGIVLIFKKSEK
jgi:hypothetical protein